MSFDLSFLVPTDKEIPSPEIMEQFLLKLPHVKKVEDCKQFVWQYEYLNLETSVSCTFSYQKPDTSPINHRAWDTGLSCSIATLCPTFVARECMPLIEQLSRQSQFLVYTPSGEMLERCDASQLQIMWTEINRKTISRMNMGSPTAPHYFPQEQLDDMWRYLNTRQALLKRYGAMGIYVPRVIIIRNKLDRKQMYLAAMWADMNPTVFPDVDAYIISKPDKLIFNRFPSGDSELIVVRKHLIEELVTPLLSKVERPIPHRLLENSSSVRLPILRSMFEHLSLRFKNFETVNVEEVVDQKV